MGLIYLRPSGENFLFVVVVVVVNWDNLTVIEMVQDIESVSQRDWFIGHIF